MTSSTSAVPGTSVELKEFYVFNPTFGNDHDDEQGKILYYYPAETHIDTQLKHVGLCEAIIRFSENFNCETPCEALHTQKTRSVFLQPEPNYWFTMVLSIPSVIRTSPDGIEMIDYYDDQVQTNVFQSVLLKLYRKFTLRHNSLQKIYKLNGIEGLKLALEKSFETNLYKVQTNHCGITDIFQGLLYLPIDRRMFLNVQCFINQFQLIFPQVQYLLILQGDKLIWTGIGQEDIQVLYDYLLKELLCQHFLSGPDKNSTFGFIVKKRSHVSLYEPPSTPSSNGVNGNTNEQSSPSDRSDDGENSADSFRTASPSSHVTSRRVSQVNCVAEQRCRKRFHLLVYKSDQSYFTMFLNDTEELDPTFMESLESFLGLNFCPLAKLLGRDYGGTGTPISGITNSIMGLASTFQLSLDTVPLSVKLLYFNKLNMAVKISPGSQCDLDSYRMLADLKQDVTEFSENGEIVVKLSPDPCRWVVAKVSNGREFYAVFNTKNSNNITEIDEEVKKLTEFHLSNIFFQD